MPMLLETPVEVTLIASITRSNMLAYFVFLLLAQKFRLQLANQSIQ